ncbi:MAG TPA: hypothetical protein VGL56_12435 [Fimbriimonadaceae bacterium]|jgi:hypothetical protein
MPRFKQAAWHDVPDKLSLVRLWLPVCLITLLIATALSANEAYMPKGSARGMGMLVLFATGTYVLWQPGRIHLKRLKQLAESCVGEEKALVRILIIQNGAITGKDHGVLYRKFGNLNFKGRRTDFSISDLALDSPPSLNKIDMVKYEVLKMNENGVQLCVTDYLYDTKPAMGKSVEVIGAWRDAIHQHSPGPVELLPPTAFLPVVRFRAFTVGWKLLVLVYVVLDLLFYVQHRSFLTAAHAIPGIPAVIAALVGLWHSAVQFRLQSKFLRGTLKPGRLKPRYID